MFGLHLDVTARQELKGTVQRGILVLGIFAIGGTAPIGLLALTGSVVLASVINLIANKILKELHVHNPIIPLAVNLLIEAMTMGPAFLTFATFQKETIRIIFAALFLIAFALSNAPHIEATKIERRHSIMDLSQLELKKSY